MKPKVKSRKLNISDFREISLSKRKKWADIVNENDLVIDGGGLLNIAHFERQLKLFEALSTKGKRVVLWGAGHNEIDKSKFGKVHSYNVNMSKFGLVGTRDYSMSKNWGPCVSYLHPIFDKKFEETREIGIVLEGKSNKNKYLKNILNGYPLISNTTNLEEMVSFIGKSNIVVTDSYYAMYWAILLGKKTAVVPTTSKFYDFKYPSVVTSFENFTADLIKTKSYTGVLEECRTLNIDFSKRVFDYLEVNK